MASAESPDGETSFAIIVSGGAGKAVRRNRVKRVIREFLRNNKDLWPSGKMVAISVSRPVTDEAALLSDIETMLRDLR
jgi:ribonuclease P protein component